MMTEERLQHCKDLAEEYDVPLRLVTMLADMLGEDEDHDGLVVSVQDYADMQLTPAVEVHELRSEMNRVSQVVAEQEILHG